MWETAATMRSEGSQEDAAAPRAPHEGGALSRRQALGRMSLIATAGAAAWVVPEILTARPAGGATLSSPGVVTGPTSDGLAGVPAGSKQGSTPSGSGPALAFTGLNIQRDTEVGAALLAGGWAMHHWASRTANSAQVEDPGAPA
jgi:hypothetical protein